MQWAQRYKNTDLTFLAQKYEEFKGQPGWEVEPAPLRERPKMGMFEQYYLNAFYVLSSSRSIGMAAGPIPVSEILIYGQYLRDDDPDAFLHIIQRMDSEYLKLESEESKRRMEKNKNKAKSRK